MASASGNQEAAEARSYCCLYRLCRNALSGLTLYVYAPVLVSDYNTLCISIIFLEDVVGLKLLLRDHQALRPAGGWMCSFQNQHSNQNLNEVYSQIGFLT